MSKNTEPKALSASFGFLSICGFIGAGYFWFMHAQQNPKLISNALPMLVLVAFTVFMFLLTITGKKLRKFTSETRNEIRKVVWPTHQEAMKYTLVTICVIAVSTIVIWAIDAVLIKVVHAAMSL